MSFKEKNILVTLVTFTLILAFILLRLFQMISTGTFDEPHVFRLWGIVIVMATVVTVVAIIVANIAPSVIQAVREGHDDPDIDDLEDERDELIDMRGTRVTYTVSSLGAFIAMLTFVLGMSPLVMFTLLIIFSVLAQIVGDITRLTLYQGGL